MKTDNLTHPGEAAVARTRGHIGKRAGTPGPTVSDTRGNDATSSDIRFIGAAVSGDSELAVVTITGTGQQATNNAGVTLEYGDVVVLDADGSVTTTTTPQDTRPVGVVQIGGADGQAVVVQFSGFVNRVNCTAAVTEGNYGETSSTPGQATENATVRSGSFCRFMESSATPSAYLFGVPATSSPGGGGGGGGLGDPEVFTAAGGTPETFTLSDTFDSVIVFRNGLLVPPADFTLTGDELDLDTAADDEIVAYPSAAAAPGGGGGVSEQPVAIVQRTSDWSTDSTANTPVEFDTEVKDTDGFYDAGDPERLTVPAEFDGMTAVLHGEAIWAAGTDYKEIKFLRNGDVDDPVAVMQVPGAATGNTGIALASRPIPVATGDYFTMVLKSGSSDTALAHPGIDGDYSLIFSITIQAGGGGSSGRWELAVIPGSPPDSLYADGDWLYIFVP